MHALARDLVMGMDSERSAEGVERRARLIEFFVDKPKASKRAAGKSGAAKKTTRRAAKPRA